MFLQQNFVFVNNRNRRIRNKSSTLMSFYGVKMIRNNEKRKLHPLFTHIKAASRNAKTSLITLSAFIERREISHWLWSTRESGQSEGYRVSGSHQNSLGYVKSSQIYKNACDLILKNCKIYGSKLSNGHMTVLIQRRSFKSSPRLWSTLTNKCRVIHNYVNIQFM